MDTNGGAIYCSSSDPTIENCKITNNVGDVGGAVYCVDSSPVISNTLIANNASAGGRPRSGGICCDQWGVPELRNCTIVHNSPGGIYTTSWEGTNVTNTIVWGNDVYQIQADECSPTVSFCDVQGGCRGDGNMNVTNPVGNVNDVLFATSSLTDSLNNPAYLPTTTAIITNSAIWPWRYAWTALKKTNWPTSRSTGIISRDLRRRMK